MGGNLKSLNKSENSFIIGDGPSTPSFGRAKINILGHVFSIDIVSRDIPGLIGMDILTSKYRNKSIFRLHLGNRQLTIEKVRLGYARWATPPRSSPRILFNLRVPLVDETQLRHF